MSMGLRCSTCMIFKHNPKFWWTSTGLDACTAQSMATRVDEHAVSMVKQGPAEPRFDALFHAMFDQQKCRKSARFIIITNTVAVLGD